MLISGEFHVKNSQLILLAPCELWVSAEFAFDFFSEKQWIQISSLLPLRQKGLQCWILVFFWLTLCCSHVDCTALQFFSSLGRISILFWIFLNPTFKSTSLSYFHCSFIVNDCMYAKSYYMTSCIFLAKFNHFKKAKGFTPGLYCDWVDFLILFSRTCQFYRAMNWLKSIGIRMPSEFSIGQQLLERSLKSTTLRN